MKPIANTHNGIIYEAQTYYNIFIMFRSEFAIAVYGRKRQIRFYIKKFVRTKLLYNLNNSQKCRTW